ncbi:MAG TPA: efflux RND transporter periplasmic adaptor subunit [Geobacteraceae bacterium]
MSEQPPARSGKRLYVAGGLLVVAALLLLLFLSGYRQAQFAKERRSRAEDAKAGPRVPVVVASRGAAERTVVLTGEARAFASVTLFAKVSGYLKEIRVDKGDRVERGQVLAVIESAELDSQYEAAVADARNKRLIAERYKTLLPSEAIARQDAESAEAAAQVAEATAASLKAQKEYEVLRAPFNATVTARFADPGALVQNATTSQTATLPIVALSETDRLRVYVYLDQRNAAFVRVGNRAEVVDAARPEVRRSARVSRKSGEIDLKSRTLLVELDLDNREGRFLAGGFVQVTLKLQIPIYVQVPVDGLLVRGEKTFVGVIDSDNRVTFRSVTVVDSDGTRASLGSGLAAGERVVLNPGTGIVEGEVIQPVGVPGR